jgi:hypothetical protein
MRLGYRWYAPPLIAACLVVGYRGLAGPPRAEALAPRTATVALWAWELGSCDPHAPAIPVRPGSPAADLRERLVSQVPRENRLVPGAGWVAMPLTVCVDPGGRALSIRGGLARGLTAALRSDALKIVGSWRFREGDPECYWETVWVRFEPFEHAVQASSASKLSSASVSEARPLRG